MSKISETAKGYETKGEICCIECGRLLKYKSLRCRDCYNTYFNELSLFAKGFEGKQNGMWKGDKVSYSGLHKWIRKYKPKLFYCQLCGRNGKLHVANISGEYRRDVNDYQWLCPKCHVYKDGTIFNLNKFNRRLNK